MTCPKCQGQEFFRIPDALAHACVSCGSVLVGGGEKLEVGKSLVEWVADLSGTPRDLSACGSEDTVME